jgi:peptidoglycan/xylan/chitin deacetylase (PgdA/CDA1 family)
LKKGIEILKGLTGIVWMAVLVFGITFLAGKIEGEDLLFARKGTTEESQEERTENRTQKLETFVSQAREAGTATVQPTEEEKYAYLTFDDGPSDQTDQILDILKEKQVKATFFVVGKTDEASKKRYLRILEEGHSLGMHSYTHDYSYIYGSMEQYKEDLEKLQDYLYDLTGQKPTLYRFPGGSSNTVSKISIQSCINYLNEQGITYFDWNASSEDAVSIGTSWEKLNETILNDALLYHNTVILMHDLHECSETVKGLPVLIDRLLEEGYTLKNITDETTPVQHIKSKLP